MIFSLKLLGGVSLEIGNEPVTGSAAQRHRLALLALLGASPSRGLSREKLMGYLWPERGGEPARKLLNQSAYALRRVLGEDAILTVGDELRFNPNVGYCDVIAYEEAVARGDLEHAVGLHAGPFLDGFFLGDAPEFEHWVQRERERLAGSLGRALEALAEAAEAVGDPGRAVELWKERAAQDAFDSRIAVRLMQALAETGNLAGALQHATVHERLLRDELGLGPAPEVRALTERLRRAPSVTTLPLPIGKSTVTAAVIEAQAAPGDIRPRPAPPSDSGTPRPKHRRRRLAGYAAGVLVLAALVVMASRMTSTSPGLQSPEAELSVAVLPLTNLSGDPRDGALADAMTDELITILAKAGNLRVISSTSVAPFRSAQIDVRSIADSLRVSYLLEGALQKVGSRIRVRVRLIDARDGATRWSESYDRDLQDVFAVQDEIGRAVARELGLHLGVEAGMLVVRQPTTNIVAYELNLRGNDPTATRSDSAAQEALENFRQAIALDSTYAAAYAGLARMHLRLAMSGDEPREERVAAAELAALKAIELDDALAEAHATLGVVRMNMHDLASAEAQLQRAITLDPTRARTHEWLVGLYAWMDRPVEALMAAERAIELDPLSPTATAELARALLLNDRCDEALARLEPLAALQPPLLRIAPIAARCYARKKMWPEAIAEMGRASNNPRNLEILALRSFLLMRAGVEEEARRLHEELIDRWEQGTGNAYAVAIAYAGLNDLDQAFTWIGRAIAEGSLTPQPGPLLTIMDPLLEDLHRDRRFASVRAHLGLQKR